MDKRLMIRISAQQRQAIQAAATAEGLASGTFVREAALAFAGQPELGSHGLGTIPVLGGEADHFPRFVRVWVPGVDGEWYINASVVTHLVTDDDGRCIVHFGNRDPLILPKHLQLTARRVARWLRGSPPDFARSGPAVTYDYLSFYGQLWYVEMTLNVAARLRIRASPQTQAGFIELMDWIPFDPAGTHWPQDVGIDTRIARALDKIGLRLARRIAG